MDTPLASDVIALELLRADASEATMTPRPIVERLDVLRQGREPDEPGRPSISDPLAKRPACKHPGEPDSEKAHGRWFRNPILLTETAPAAILLSLGVGSPSGGGTNTKSATGLSVPTELTTRRTATVYRLVRCVFSVVACCPDPGSRPRACT